MSLFSHKEGKDRTSHEGLDCPRRQHQRRGPATGISTVQIKFCDGRQYLPEAIAGKEFQKLFLKFLQGRIQREE